MCLSGVRVSNEYVDDILLAILLHDDIIDWRYFAWRDYAGDISSVHPRPDPDIRQPKYSDGNTRRIQYPVHHY